MLFEITHKQDRSVLFSLETESIKLCVEAAARSGTNLGGTNLGGANLGGAELYHSHFFGRGGRTKIKKTQVEEFHAALGVIIEE